jgi:hypothetical protein
MNGATVGIASLAAVAVGLCVLLRIARPRRDARDSISAWAIMSGLAAATALGPALLGRADPALHARIITGVTADSPEATALEQAQARLRADAAAGAAAGAAADPATGAMSEGASPGSTPESDAAFELRRAQDAVAAASRSFTAPRRAVATWLAVLLIILCWPRLRREDSSTAPTASDTTPSPSAITALVAWTVTLPALLAYMAMRMWVGAELPASICAAAACATGATFPTATAWRAARRSDGAGGALVSHAGAWSLPIAAAALAAAFVAAHWSDGASVASVVAALRAHHPALAIAACSVCVACAIAPIAGRWLAPPDVSEGSPLPVQSWRGITIDALTAATVALAVADLDPLSWDFVWAAAIFALIAEDGRWLAGWAACYLQGTHTSRDAARVGAMLEENSRPMVAVVAAAIALGLLAVHEAALLCAAAWALDLTWGVRRLISVAPARQVPQE